MQFGGDGLDATGQVGEGQGVAGGEIDEGLRGVAAPLVERRPQRADGSVVGHRVGVVRRCRVAATRGRRRRRRSAQSSVDERGEPGLGDAGDVGFGHHQVIRSGEAVQGGVREPAGEIGGEVVVEHGVASTPRQQHGCRDRRQPVSHLGDRRFGRVAGLQWDVAHEVGDRRPGRRSAIRGTECLAVDRGDPPS